MAMNLWSDLLVLQARFEERSRWRGVLGPTEDDEAEASVWGKALEELTAVLKKHTHPEARVKP